MTAISAITLTQTGTRVDALVNNHTIVIDQPEESGGTNAGPRAREMFLISLGGCFIQNLNAAIKARQADIHDVQVEVIGIQSEKPKRIVGVELRVSARYQDEKLMRKLAEMSERGCLISNTVRGAVDISVSVHQLEGINE